MNSGINVSLQELLDLKSLAAGLDITQQPKVRSQLLGGHLSIMRGRGMEFAEVRSYQAGDDIRHMEWRVTARTGEPYVKLYREERERPVFLVVDFNPSMFFGTKVAFKSVIGARIAAILAWATIKKGDRIGGLLYSGQQHLELKPYTRHKGILPLLKGLSDFSQMAPSTSFSFAEACLTLRRIIKPGALVIIISDFSQMDNESCSQLRRLAVHQQLLACYIRDPLEINAPPAARYPISDGQQQSLLNTYDKKLCAEYTNYFTELYQARLNALQQINIPTLSFLTNDDLVHILQKFFHRGL